MSHNYCEKRQRERRDRERREKERRRYKEKLKEKEKRDQKKKKDESLKKKQDAENAKSQKGKSFNPDMGTQNFQTNIINVFSFLSIGESKRNFY